MRQSWCRFVILVMLGASAGSFACTGITVTTKDGSVISSRTLEFEVDLKSDVLMIPRGCAMAATLAGGGTGLTWRTKYACIGANAFHVASIAEGLNEKGLGAGAFYLPGYAEYQKLTPANAPKAMLSTDFVAWILSNFATLDEVRANLPGAVVVEGVPPGVDSPMPLHWRITDVQSQVLLQNLRQPTDRGCLAQRFGYELQGNNGRPNARSAQLSGPDRVRKTGVPSK